MEKCNEYQIKEGKFVSSQRSCLECHDFPSMGANWADFPGMLDAILRSSIEWNVLKKVVVQPKTFWNSTQ
jgi:hypothetical protein